MRMCLAYKLAEPEMRKSLFGNTIIQSIALALIFPAHPSIQHDVSFFAGSKLLGLDLHKTKVLVG